MRTKAKKFSWIAAILFALHTFEESTSRFWDTDPLINIAAQTLHVPALWLYWGGQALLYGFLFMLLVSRNQTVQRYGPIALAVLLLAELEHLAAGLDFGYTPGLLTGTLLSAYGVFYATTLIRRYAEKIENPVNEELQKNLIGIVSLVALLYAVISIQSLFPARPPASVVNAAESGAYATTTAQVSEEVLPAAGFKTKIILGSIVLEMVADGIIDMSKVQALYKNTSGIPPKEMQMLTQPSNESLIVDANNASWLINVLWPIGLANKMGINDQSPIAGKNVGNFASTGGWSLGKANSGGAYFNAYPLIPLTLEQEQRVKQIASSVYRPCCNNSTFFQDCNHGSAALALVELGVSEGLSDADIYQTLLEFNSFWFPQNYLETGLYFKVIKNTDWSAVDPKIVLSADYSSLSGWMKNVDAVVSKVPGLVPQTQTSGSCGV